MRGMYWKPQGASQVQRALVAALAIVGLIAVERFPSEERQPYYGEKLAAARTAKEAFDVIRDTAEAKGIRIRPETDPAASGLIGEVLSPITSGSGSLVSKQTTVNPNFAAVVVEWLKDLGIQSGDLVAVGASGSFPAMNIAVYSALHQLGADPIIITSAAASQYGANVPNFTWLDMEATLRREGVFPYKSVAASRGGVGDEAIGLTKRGRRMWKISQRHHRPSSPARTVSKRLSGTSPLPIRTRSSSGCGSTAKMRAICRSGPTST